MTKNRRTKESDGLIQIVLLRTEEVHPNTYNPNEMSEEEYQQLVNEVRRLGRVPKPIVVRPQADRYVIVDGEHSWKAAREIGLEQITCEVIGVDEFDAMRESFKRNQHGTHNPLLLGRMFKRMMEERGLSQRALARQIDVSEGTVRNALEYAEAAEVRNDYAPDRDTDAEIVGLSLHKVRAYNRLPRGIANLWLDSGAQPSSLWDCMRGRLFSATHASDVECTKEGLLEFYKDLVATGLDEFLPSVKNGVEFYWAMQKLVEWRNIEQDWAVGGVTPESLRPYLQPYIQGNPCLHDRASLIASVRLLVDARQSPPAFRLTPGEFEAVLQESKEREDYGTRFLRRLRQAILEKGLEIPESEKSADRGARARGRCQAEARCPSQDPKNATWLGGYGRG